MSSPHDALFKYVFSQPEHAASALRSLLPEALSQRLDWSSLELQPASFVGEQELRSRSLTAVATAGLMLLGRGRTAPNLLEELRRWLDVLGEVGRAQNGVEALAAFLEYAFRVGEVPPEELRQLAAQLGPVAEEAYMTAAQKLTEESYARGRAKGKAELLIRLLGVRFGALSDAVRETILSAPSERLDVWAERVISGQTLDEVLS